MSFLNFEYIPMLNVRQAEMRALEELPSQTKDAMLPYIVLQPWASAKELASAVARVNAAVGLRTIIVDIGEEQPFKGERRPVHDAFDSLRVSANGYKNYVDFLVLNGNFLPSLQLADLTQLDAQIRRLAELNRDITVRLREPMFQYARDIAARFQGRIPAGSLHFILDFEKQNREILVKSAIAVQTIRNIRSTLPECSVSVSASTFPESFVGLAHQDIFEREFHAVVRDAIQNERLIYCDRGSVRAEALGGGGGLPAPRIDIASISRWHFFRVDDAADKHSGFRRAANDAMEDDCWTDLGIWGTEYIKRTGKDGETDTIDSAAKCTAARINIHLHTQATGGKIDGGDEVGWAD
ncbi:hypothetical protein WA845_02685 [Agrobacterium sp. CMT1]|uniref:beta family protein n=1 Tax=Agrobacterium sp. CMT1 TaxID=3128901 RepID=UPI000DD884EC